MFLRLCYTGITMKKTSFIALIVLILIFLGLGYVAYVSKTTPAPQIRAVSTTYICKDNKIIGVKFYTQLSSPPKASVNDEPPVPTGSADVTLSDGRSLRLSETISGSGVRYANKDESFILWTKGTGAIVLEDNEEKNYIDCEERLRSSSGGNATTTKKYFYNGEYFSLILPRFTTPPQLARTDSYTVDESHSYELIPGEAITGVKFTIPSAVTQGTNLSKDSYISIEHIANTKKCTADMFLEGEQPISIISENGVTYSVASTTGAAAGNRYEELVYATKSKATCLGVRYFIHYSVFENYPRGTIKEFSKQILLQNFDTIRKSLTLK
jgi:membrane-bound inhibitor of C-type lysozyme